MTIMAKDRRSVEREIDEMRTLGEMSKGIEPDLPYEPGKGVKGKFIKHYRYDEWDEVYVELFENGAVFCELGKGCEWYDKKNQQRAFDKAKLRGERSRGLNRMFK
jgi:hypothetical protein